MKRLLTFLGYLRESPKTHHTIDSTFETPSLLSLLHSFLYRCKGSPRNLQLLIASDRETEHQSHMVLLRVFCKFCSRKVVIFLTIARLEFIKFLDNMKFCLKSSLVYCIKVSVECLFGSVMI